jgi:Flp pilus assembly protein TadG
MRKILQFIRDQRGDFAQFAIVAPVLILVSLGLLDAGMLGVAGMHANNAANYGARIGSVAQENPTGQAYAAATSKLEGVTVGDYTVHVSATGSGRGSLIRAQVTYSVENYFGGLSRMFGVETGDAFVKNTIVYFRQEGW